VVGGPISRTVPVAPLVAASAGNNHASAPSGLLGNSATAAATSESKWEVERFKSAWESLKSRVVRETASAETKRHWSPQRVECVETWVRESIMTAGEERLSRFAMFSAGCVIENACRKQEAPPNSPAKFTNCDFRMGSPEQREQWISIRKWRNEVAHGTDAGSVSSDVVVSVVKNMTALLHLLDPEIAIVGRPTKVLGRKAQPSAGRRK
jgi:hypothetical protein